MATYQVQYQAALGTKSENEIDFRRSVAGQYQRNEPFEVVEKGRITVSDGLDVIKQWDVFGFYTDNPNFATKKTGFSISTTEFYPADLNTIVSEMEIEDINRVAMENVARYIFDHTDGFSYLKQNIILYKRNRKKALAH